MFDRIHIQQTWASVTPVITPTFSMAQCPVCLQMQVRAIWSIQGSINLSNLFHGTTVVLPKPIILTMGTLGIASIVNISNNYPSSTRLTHSIPLISMPKYVRPHILSGWFGGQAGSRSWASNVGHECFQLARQGIAVCQDIRRSCFLPCIASSQGAYHKGFPSV